jgi:hypothetical protein
LAFLVYAVSVIYTDACGTYTMRTLFMLDSYDDVA